MFTLSLIAAILCVVAAAANIHFAQRARRTLIEYRTRLDDMTRMERRLQERQYDLDKRENSAPERVHVYSTVAVDDPDNSAPDFPDTATFKKLKSQMGYYVVPKFKENIVRRHMDGKTIYTLDLYVLPYPYNGN